MHQARFRILTIVKTIPRGKVSSYAAIARAAHTSPRAVGAVMRANRNKDVPCHRVVLSSRAPGGFNRGVKKKTRLLRSEGVVIENNRIGEKFFFRPSA